MEKCPIYLDLTESLCGLARVYVSFEAASQTAESNFIYIFSLWACTFFLEIIVLVQLSFEVSSSISKVFMIYRRTQESRFIQVQYFFALFPPGLMVENQVQLWFQFPFFSFIFTQNICMKTGSLFLSEHLAQIGVQSQSTHKCKMSLRFHRSETHLWSYQLSFIIFSEGLHILLLCLCK